MYFITFRRLILLPTLVAVLALIAAACSGGGGDGDGDSGDGQDSGITPIVANSELVVGENRLMVGLISADNEEITNAQVAFRFFKLDGTQEELRGEAQATPIILEKSYTHVHDDGTVETHSAGESGVYVANVTFDEAGQWGIEITPSIEGQTFDPVGATFEVLPQANTVAIGAPAPLSETLTLDDVADVSEIDTSDPPIPEMHTMTIAEAVTSGKPTVIAFATPAFCLSRVCGPAKQAVDDLFAEYQDQANFVHVEPYELDKARSGEGLIPIKATEEWGLLSEPWVFIVDSDGNVAAKFEAFLTLDELRTALTPLVASAAPAGTIGY